MKNRVLTAEDIDNMEPGCVFAKGIIENSTDGIYMTSENVGKKLLWVAKSGNGDWAVYADWAPKPALGMITQFEIDSVAATGTKVTLMDNIKKLVPCDAKAISRYRY